MPPNSQTKNLGSVKHLQTVTVGGGINWDSKVINKSSDGEIIKIVNENVFSMCKEVQDCRLHCVSPTSKEGAYPKTLQRLQRCSGFSIFALTKASF
jgi:hypothetical protein